MRSLYRLAVILLLSASVAVGTAVFLKSTEYLRDAKYGSDCILALYEQRPADVPEQQWADAVSWAHTAYCNTMDERFVPHHELEAFIEDAQLQFAEPIGLSTIDWIWNRLAEAGPIAREYVERWQPSYQSTVYGAMRSYNA